MLDGNGPEGAVGCICIAWLLVAGSGTALKAQDATGSAPVSEAKTSLRQAVSPSPPAVSHRLAPHPDTDPAPAAEHRMRRRSERASLRIAAVAGDEDEPSLLRYSLYGAGIGAAVGAGVGA